MVVVVAEEMVEGEVMSIEVVGEVVGPPLAVGVARQQHWEMKLGRRVVVLAMLLLLLVSLHHTCCKILQLLLRRGPGTPYRPPASS